MRSASAPATGATMRNVAGPRQQPQPGAEGVVAKRRSAGAGRRRTPPRTATPNTQKIAALPAENARERKKRIGSIGSRRAPLPGDEAATRSAPGGERADHLGAPPAGGVAAHEPPDDAERAGRDERRGRAGRARCRRRSSRACARARAGRRASPIGTLSQKIHCQSMPCDDGAADQRAAGDRDPGDRAEEADRRAAPLGRERGAQQRQAERHASAPRRRPGQRGRRSASRRSGASAQAAEASANSAEPDGVEPPAAEAVAERRGGDQQHREAEVVGVDGPLELADRRAEIERGSCVRAVETTSVSSAAMSEPIAVRTTTQVRRWVDDAVIGSPITRSTDVM